MSAPSTSASAAAPASDVVVAGEVNRMIQAEVIDIYKRLEKLRQQAKFPSFDTVNVPMVLVLGNHSSGKSTFINHMLQQEVQKTGRAPTDCTFTVLVGGQREERLDGSALVRHAKYGFGDVQRLFGREFVSQVELKVVEKSPLLDQGGLMIVDSPGMIDPPGASTDRTDTDRGYDFKQVVQWFADRADVILVMFDPDKPGTTFETLDVLTNSLRDMNSKVLLILNKVDDFRTVHDFARAYGALCWNLSKVIPRKDLPFIYTMYVPHDDREGASKTKKKTTVKTAVASLENGNGQASSTPPQQSSPPAHSVQHMLEHEFDGTRGEVIREVERAPDRATDNVLNLLKSTASRLKMHVTLVEACRKEYFDLELFWKRVQIAGVVAGVGVAAFYLIRTVGRAPVVQIADVEKLAGASSSAPAAAPVSGSGSAPASGSPPSSSGASTTTTSTSSTAASSVSAAKAAPAAAASRPSSSGSSASSAAPRGGGTTPALRGSSNSPPTDKTAWKQNWAKQVAKSQSPFRFTTFFKIILSAAAGNFAIWKTSVLRLERKREEILAWLPATFERVYAKFLVKSDRTHNDIAAQWLVVRPGLELALAAAPIDQFDAFQTSDKSYLDDVLGIHIPRLDRCVRDRTGDDHAYLRFKHLQKPSVAKASQ
jgi:predicted GTPase